MSVIGDFLRSIAGISQTRVLNPAYWQLCGNVITIKIDDVPELQRHGGAVCLQGNGLKEPVLVVCDNDGGYHSFSNKCTHFGRKLDPVPGQPVLRCCSVSHSTFDYLGNSLTGPAGKPIRVYRAELKNGDLTIVI
ncbi:MAG: Rieske 2Fe-2S domain-containing protein [Pseudomonadota bacterium]